MKPQFSVVLLSLVVGSVVFLLMRSDGCNRQSAPNDKIETLGRATGPVIPEQTPKPDLSPSETMPPVETMPPRALTQNDAEAETIHQGEVVETIDASRYTYIHLRDTSGAMIWAAVPKAQLSKGETVSIIQSLVMTDFRSKTLDRTFPSVIFGILMRQREPSSDNDASLTPDTRI